MEFRSFLTHSRSAAYAAGAGKICWRNKLKVIVETLFGVYTADVTWNRAADNFMGKSTWVSRAKLSFLSETYLSTNAGKVDLDFYCSEVNLRDSLNCFPSNVTCSKCCRCCCHVAIRTAMSSFDGPCFREKVEKLSRPLRLTSKSFRSAFAAVAVYRDRKVSQRKQMLVRWRSPESAFVFQSTPAATPLCEFQFSALFHLLSSLKAFSAANFPSSLESFP